MAGNTASVQYDEVSSSERYTKNLEHIPSKFASNAILS